MWSHESSEVTLAYWDVPVSEEQEHQPQNRVDAQFVDHKEKTVIAVEVSCLWVENRMEKDVEKMRKYGPLNWDLKQQHPGYTSQHHLHCLKCSVLILCN